MKNFDAIKYNFIAPDVITKEKQVKSSGSRKGFCDRAQNLALKYCKRTVFLHKGISS